MLVPRFGWSFVLEDLSVARDVLRQAVEVFLQLPSQSALADARDAHQRDQPRSSLPRRGVIEILEELQLVVATDEGRLDAGRATHALASGHDAHRPPGRHGQGLALDRLIAGRLEGDGVTGSEEGRLADQDLARRGGRLQS